MIWNKLQNFENKIIHKTLPKLPPKISSKDGVSIFHFENINVKTNLIIFTITNRASSSRTGEYWAAVVAVRTERSEVRTKTTEGP